jgi:exodeoxyribonuclease VII large subunit
VADLVADRRAPTPTAAASLVVPDRRDLIAALRSLQTSLTAGMTRQIEHQRDRLDGSRQRLRDPRQALKALQLRVDELSERLQRAVNANIRAARHHLERCVQHLDALSPLAVLRRGYTITRRADDSSVVRDAGTLVNGDLLHLTFAQGTAAVRVESAARPSDEE